MNYGCCDAIEAVIGEFESHGLIRDFIEAEDEERLALQTQAACEALRDLLARAHHWVPVKHALPSAGEQVWVRFSFGTYTGQGYAIYRGDDDWFFDLDDYGDLYSRRQAVKDGLHSAEVTHWMPLPQEPE